MAVAPIVLRVTDRSFMRSESGSSLPQMGALWHRDFSLIDLGGSEKAGGPIPGPSVACTANSPACQMENGSQVTVGTVPHRHSKK